MELPILYTLLLTTWGIAGLLILVQVTLIWLIAQLKGDNSVMDIAYGPIFAITSWGTIWLTATLPSYSYLVAIGITLWATRLGWRIGKKNWGRPEDPRYAAWRTEWMQRGRLYFMLRSYLQISLLQGFIISIVLLPMLVAITTPIETLTWWFVLGIVVFLFGLTYEATADWQLDRFLKGKRAGTISASLMQTGLFRFSRRPNYFGEATIWWGWYITVIGLPGGIVAVLSPLLITYILAYVTGPMLEAVFLEKYPEAYARYQATTNYLIPGRPRTNNTLQEEQTVV